jgi:hypothetical protein
VGSARALNVSANSSISSISMPIAYKYLLIC